MPDVDVSSLDARQQKLVENARRALARGNHDYVRMVCAEILRGQPGCVEVRRLQRAARVRRSGANARLARTLGGLTALPFTLGAHRRDPAENLARAEKLLERDPDNVPALRLLGEAALGFDWPQTAILAFEAIREIDPADRSNLLSLGEAWLRAGQPGEALRVADEILRLQPVDGDAQTLMRKASIARATEKGNWEQGGDFRTKVKADAHQPPAGPPAPATPALPPLQPTAGESPSAVAPTDPLAAARERVERYPGDLEARFQLAELLFAAGEVEAAIAQYQHAQRHPQWRPAALLGLARCFRVRGLTDLAVVQLTTANGELSAMDDRKKDVIYELGLCHEALGQTEAAIAQFKAIYAEDIGFRDVAAKINAHYSAS
ncbi:MAG: tetratricopeptide repeat protein [Opitutaceae bacterium]|nr:tetratricopeptide repeat protein [Opitutaceae bacterium]